MNQVVMRANAKINLSLDITGRRKDGYHLMDMVMQSVTLHDTVSLRKQETVSISLQLENGAAGLSADEKNTAYKAAVLFFSSTGLSGGADIRLVKRIPQEAGMAGGSADAAAVLAGLNRLYETGLSLQELMDIGVKVGADVPFCLTGGTARVQGIGEIVIPVPLFNCGTYVIVKPPFGISTPLSFQRFDMMGGCRRPDNDILLMAMAAKDLRQVRSTSANVLEQATESPEINAVKNRLYSLGADFSLMTGSGSAVFGLFAQEQKAKVAAQALQGCGRVCLCSAAPSGIEVENIL